MTWTSEPDLNDAEGREIVSDAALIAAAPDLLAALENLLALTELHIAERSKTPEEEDNFLSCHHITQARAAIAKTKA